MILMIYLGISAVFGTSFINPNYLTKRNASLELGEFHLSDQPNAQTFHADTVTVNATRKSYDQDDPAKQNKVVLRTKRGFGHLISSGVPLPGDMGDLPPLGEMSILNDTYFQFDKEDPVKTIETFCQRTMSCYSGNPSDNQGNGRDCCLPCDCSDKCFDVGNCCFDKMNGSLRDLENPSDMRETCVQTGLSGSDRRINVMSFSFLLIQTCVDNGDHETKRKCLQPNISRFSEMTPVVSLSTERHYRNIFCAQCNNDSLNVTEWQIRLQCTPYANTMLYVPELTQPSDFSPLQIVLMNPRCLLLFPPPVIHRQPAYCLRSQDIESDCDEPELDVLCKKYYSPVLGGEKIYRNVFCMKCANRKCGIPHIELGTTDFISVLSLTANPKKNSEVDGTKNNCLLPTEHIKELDACYHRTCPITEVSVVRGCIPLFSELTRINIDYRLKLLYPLDVASWLFSAHDENILNVLSIIGISEKDICFYNVYETKMTSHFLEMKVQIIKSILTHDINIQTSYLELEKKFITYNELNRNNASAIRVQLETPEFEPIPDGSLSYAKFKDITEEKCENKIAMSKMQFCETLTFLAHEFKMYGNGSVTIDEVMLVPGEFILRQRVNRTIKSVQVCLDHFISKRAEIENLKKYKSSAAFVIDQVNSGHLPLLLVFGAQVFMQNMFISP